MVTDEWIGRTIPSRNTDPQTSHDAASRIIVTANNQRGKLLAPYFSQVALERQGLTDDEAQELSGVGILSCWWKRCSELREGGFIEWTGMVRKGSADVDRMVCKVTGLGIATLISMGH